MGIPVFFKTCIEDYKDICRKVDNDKIIDHLFLDLNCLIHPCCQGETDETIMIGKIIKKMKYLFDLILPKQTFFIAIDGPCPKPKMIQQRIRRFKSIHEHKIWDTNAITPGTKFMEKLEIEILNNLSLFSIIRGKTIFSSCLEPGEGEHKIFDYIKKHKIDNNVIYGLDADLIMLSLISTSDNIQLLRETTKYCFTPYNTK
jgi:5'-3' exonuclease